MKSRLLFLILFLIINLNAVDVAVNILSGDKEHVVSPRGNIGVLRIEWEIVFNNTSSNESYFIEIATISASGENIQLEAFSGDSVSGSSNGFLQSEARFDYTLSESIAQNLPLSGQTLPLNLTLSGIVRITTTTTNPDGTTETTVENRAFSSSQTANMKIFPARIEVKESGQSWGDFSIFSPPDPTNTQVTISKNDLEIAYEIETNLNTILDDNRRSARRGQY